MPQHIIFVTDEGEIRQIALSANPTSYPIGEIVNGMTCMWAPEEFNDAIEESAQTKWFDNGIWKDRIKKPGDFHEWKEGTWVANTAKVLASLKSVRDAHLRNTDWTQIEDAPTDKKAWKDYRQALRDLPSLYPNITHIDQVVWPSPPG